MELLLPHSHLPKLARKSVNWSLCVLCAVECRPVNVFRLRLCTIVRWLSLSSRLRLLGRELILYRKARGKELATLWLGLKTCSRCVSAGLNRRLTSVVSLGLTRSILTTLPVVDCLCLRRCGRWGLSCALR